MKQLYQRCCTHKRQSLRKENKKPLMDIATSASLMTTLWTSESSKNLKRNLTSIEVHSDNQSFRERLPWKEHLREREFSCTPPLWRFVFSGIESGIKSDSYCSRIKDYRAPRRWDNEDQIDCLHRGHQKIEERNHLRNFPYPRQRYVGRKS